MSQDKLKRLRNLEETIETLKELRVRASERLTLLRKQRDEYLKELKSLGVNPTKVKEQLVKLSNSIDKEIDEIEAQIPPNLTELLLNDENSRDRNKV